MKPTMFQLCSNYVSTMFQLCSNYVPTMFQLCSNYVPTMFQLCSNYVSTMFQLCSNYVSTMFQLCFNYVPTMFQLCSSICSSFGHVFGLKNPQNEKFHGASSCLATPKGGHKTSAFCKSSAVASSNDTNLAPEGRRAQGTTG